jgi:Tol biopolymer transport system component
MAGIARADFCDRGRIVMVTPGGPPRVLTEGFHGACDPDLSFDGRRLLFAGKRDASDLWNIFEMDLETREIRRITDGPGNCRAPTWQGTLYTIVSPEPWDQISFVSDGTGEWNEYGPLPSTSLYSVKLDGTEVRRLTFNPSSEVDPTVLPDGRLLFSSWQRGTLERGFEGRVALFAVQTDGIDIALFAGDEGKRFKLMPAVTPDRRVIFVETERPPWDGAGNLAEVSLRRNLHSHRPLTAEGDGLFHSPSPLPDGSILVSRRPRDGGGTHGVYRFDPDTGEIDVLFDDPDRHDVQATIIAPRPLPDGRSSVVKESVPTGALYGLNVYDSDLPAGTWITAGTASRLRILEGIPRRSGSDPFLPEAARVGVAGPGSTRDGIPPVLQKRFLGEIPVEPDGSFNVRVPANIPIQLQLLDESGMALRTCAWIWVRSNETRGCIGCHEDGERVPANRFVQALQRESTRLLLPPEKRRTIDFRRDVMPIVTGKCAAAGCHGGDAARLRLDAGGETGEPGPFNRAYVNLLAGAAGGPRRSSPFGRYVHPGRARTSPLIWHLYGWNTSRPWDRGGMMGAPQYMPPPGAEVLTDDEKRTLVEWIDLGALWNGIPPAAAPLAGSGDAAGGTR